MTHLLDTNVCVWLLRGRQDVRARAATHAPGDLAVATMTEAELRYGVINGSNSTFMAPVDTLLAQFRVLPFDRGVARAHAEARRALRHQPIGERDLVIASVALAHGLTVATGNVREFARVPGLVVEDWTA